MDQTVYKEGSQIKCKDERVDSIGYFGTPVISSTKTDISFKVVISFRDGSTHESLLKTDDWEKETSEFLNIIK